MSSTTAPAEPASPAPATVSLPAVFSNSFWSHDYREGFERVYSQLEASVNASNEVLQAVQQRATAERAFAHALAPPALRQDGFAQDEGASLRAGFEAILTSAVGEARARLKLADDLIRSIATPFEAWSQSHAGRISSSRALVEGHLIAWEKAHSNVLQLKSRYEDSCRLADQAEDEYNFSRSSPAPSSAPAVAHTPLDLPVVKEDKGKGKGKELPPPPPGQVQKAVDDDERSLDGIDDDDDDDTVIPRSGLVGGAGIASALGRAMTTIRRKPAASTTSDGEGAQGSAGIGSIAADPTVGKAVDWGKTTFSSIMERVAGPQTGEARNERARKHAEEVEAKYKSAVIALDNLRLILEEALAEHLTYVQRCESDRLKATASVLRSFHIATAALPKLIAGSHERVSTTLELMRPEKDVQLTIERNRTGPFQPKPVIFHSHYSEPAIQSFGIDLRKFAETNTNSAVKVPPVLTFLLQYIDENYSKATSDVEKRKIWLYETSLAAQHHLRSALNQHTDSFSKDTVASYDLPVVASVVKLWLLELEVPPLVYSHYDEFRDLYKQKQVGQETVEVPAKVIADHLSRLPPVHLEVLRVLVGHFAQLISSTKTEEADAVYIQKLSLSLSRCLIRPRQETALTLGDRFPALLFADLIKSREVIFSSADELKLGRDDRYKPRRQRTRPTDARISRSKMGLHASEAIDRESADALLKRQQNFASPPTSPPGPRVLPSLNVPSSSAQQQAPSAGYAASPMDLHAPQELPPPVAPTSAPVAPPKRPVTPPHPDPSGRPAFAEPQLSPPSNRPVFAEPQMSPPSSPRPAPPTQPQQQEEEESAPKGGSISRSSRTRGARGPGPLSTASTGAGEDRSSFRDSFTRSSVGYEESEAER